MKKIMDTIFLILGGLVWVTLSFLFLGPIVFTISSIIVLVVVISSIIQSIFEKETA